MMYKDWEEAARHGKWRMAVGQLVIEHKGKPLAVEVIKPLTRDGFLVFKGTFVKIRQATTKEIDSVKRWKPW